MAIVLYKRPSDYNWSGNPIHYRLYSAAAEADPTNVFEIRIHFKRTDAADYSEVVTLPYNPVNGTADVDIQDVLNSLLEYETPYLPADNEYNSPLSARKCTGLFYIAWREITTATPDPAWTTSESANAKFVIKGGIAFHKWRGDNYWVNLFDVSKPFLTWQQTGRLAGYNERMYLAWLNLTDVDPFDIKMKRSVVFTDNTEYTFYHNCVTNKYEVAYFPAGAAQLKLQNEAPDKKIFYWELTMWDDDADVALSQTFRYYADNRNDYNGITLNYRNSLGGFDSARVRGVIEYNLTRQFTEAGSIVQHDYFMGYAIMGRSRALNSTELLIYKGDIGHLSREEQDRLRDIHFQREVWWEQQHKWLPVITMTGDQKLKTTEDMRWSMPIEFAIASGGDRYYTPDSVDLAEGSFPEVNVCNAIISVPTYDGAGPWTVNWNLISGAPWKYYISTPGVSGGAPHETISTSYVFDWLPPGDNLIKVQPLCKIGDEVYFGTPQYVTITVAASCVAVGISGSPTLPDAESGDAYSYTINLTGTAPFSLSNVIKPAWMTIAVVGSTIEFGGTPGDVHRGANIEVSFTVSNCSGEHIDFSQDINVAPGTFSANNATDSFTITSITAFYTLTSGSLPLGPSSTLEGTHDGFTGTIAVHVTGVTTILPSPLTLIVNGAIIDTYYVTDVGVYPFSVDFPTGSIVELTFG